MTKNKNTIKLLEFHYHFFDNARLKLIITLQCSYHSPVSALKLFNFGKGFVVR